MIPMAFFIYGLFGKVAVMGRTGWPAMIFLLRDLLHCFQLDLFSVAAAIGNHVGFNRFLGISVRVL
jgi:hypothetical protein